MSFCRSCGAPLKWVKSLRDKAMPLDPDPVDAETKGAIVVWRDRQGVERGAGYAIAAGEIALAETVSVQRARSLIADGDYPAHLFHFATCPNAGLHRR